ncbi:MAG: fibronectin type III domain-containing protein, partial [Chitinophagales bacterium]|nr:fibronectin type III domain-containing protein [Chitinophagales bacterium]
MKNYLLIVIGLIFSFTKINGQYCSPNTGSASFECITNVSFVNINNTTNCTDGAPVDYTWKVANVNRGLTYTLKVTIHADVNEYVYAFIDWNQNGILNDPGETYTVVSNTSSNGPFSIDITVPVTASLGNTRMRVINAFDLATPSPCLNNPYNGEAEDYTVNVGVQLSCLPPSNLNNSLVTPTTAKITWDEANPIPNIGYQWELRTSGAPESGPTGLVQSGNTNSLTKNFNNLTGNTNYTFYIRSNCDVNDNSTWYSTSFTTLSPGQIGSGNGSSNNSFPIYTSYNYNYSQQIYLASELADALGTGNTYITKIKFKQLSVGNPSTYNSWKVFIGHTTKNEFIDNTDWISFNQLTQVYSGNLSFNANSWVEINFNSPFIWNGVDNLVVAVDENTAGASSSSFAVFDVSTNRGLLYYNSFTNPNPATPPNAVYGPNATIAQIQFVATALPSCLPPSNVTLSNLLSTSAVINWDAANPVPNNGYQWEIRTSGLPGSGPSGLKQSSSTNGLSANPINLTPNTNYTFYVRANCGNNNFSTWTNGIHFKTPCNAVNIPYSEDFESVNIPDIPNCTTTQNAGVGNDWVTGSGNPSAPLGKYLRYTFHPTEPADAWFFTRGLNLTAGVSYRLSYKYNAALAIYPENLKVAYGMGALKSAMTQTLADHQNLTNINQLTNTIDFVPPTSGVYYIGFNCYSLPNQFYLYVDDISVILSPPCVIPGNIIPSSIAQTTATVSWDAPTPIPNYGYQYELRKTGNPGSGPVGLVNQGITSSLNKDFTGLTTVTTYKFYIRSICNIGDTSAWSGAIEFTTSVNRPWTEGFLSQSLPTGWVNNSNWLIGSVRGVTGNPGNTIYKNLWIGAPSGNFITVPVGPILAGDRLAFDYKIANFNQPYLPPGNNWGNFKVLISANSGPWEELVTINETPSVRWETKVFDLSSYVGKTIRIKIDAVRIDGDFDLAFDNFKIATGCPEPSAQPTNLVLTPSATSVAGSFTAANPLPTGYLVVRTNGNTPSNPVNGVNYTIGRPALGGVVVAAGPSTSFNAVNLSPGQTYSFFVYSYNVNNGCLGITYLTASPLTDNTLTKGLFTSVKTGNWEDPTTWNQNNVPSATDEIIIANTHTVTVHNTAAASADITIESGGKLIVSANSLDASAIKNNGMLDITGGTITIIGTNESGITNNVGSSINITGGNIKLGNNGGGNRTFLNNGTLSISNGTLTINGNYAQLKGTLVQTGGNIIVDGNAAGNINNSVASGIPIFQVGDVTNIISPSQLNLSAGNITIVDPHASATPTNSVYFYVGSNFSATGSHTFKFGDGISVDAGGNENGFIIYPNASSLYYALNNVVVNTGNGTNRIVTFNSFPLRMGGDLTISSGELLNDNGLYINGKIINNGTMTNTGVLYFGNYTNGSILASSRVQTITGTGVYRNEQTSPTANFTRVTFNNTNSNGITFGAGINKPSFSGLIDVITGNVNADDFNLNGTITITLSTSNSIINVKELHHNIVGTVSLVGAGKVNVYNAFSFANINGGNFDAGGCLVLKSTATGTARIADITNGGINNNAIFGNIIQERYVPSKATRRWIFLANPLTQSITDSWQQQMHVTGSGNGGSPCPNLSVNDNGFDVTLTNAPSMYMYDASQVQWQRWKVIPNTYMNLEPGKGFRVNVRGDRNIYGCSLLDGTKMAPDAVTLKSEGAIGVAQKNMGSFNITYPNNGVGNYVFVGNPYSSNISFAALQADNWATLGSTYAIYIPSNPASIYTYWDDNAGEFTGGAGGDDATGNIIANGQAVFLESAVAGNLTINFNETQKTEEENLGYFRPARVFNEKVKVSYLQNNNKVDE